MRVTGDWNVVWEEMACGGERTGALPELMRAPLPGGWLVASRVSGGWSVTWVPEAGGGMPDIGQFPELSTERVSRDQLDGYLGKHISAICGNKQVNDKSNHCAHFANHVMQLDFAYNCRKASGRKEPGANLRVHETFTRCGAVGAWPPPPSITQCFAFVTKKSNVNLKKKEMTNVPKKHIGIFHSDHIWHYSNSKRKVVKQLPADFARHYKGDGFGVFYGEFPPAA
jgi:hypothetical protein